MFSHSVALAASSRVIRSDAPDVVSALAADDVGAVVWDRVNPCDGDTYPLYAAPTRQEWSSLPDWLQDDLAVLSNLLTRAVGGEDYTIRLETAEQRTCPRFHQDNVRLRLLTTYRGPGVEWACSSGLGVISTARTGSVVLMKGRLWPTRGSTLLHRSPKASRRKPRWVLAMDIKDGGGAR